MGQRKRRRYIFILWLAVVVAFAGSSGHAVAKENDTAAAGESGFPGSVREEGLEAQVRAYYEARGVGDLEKMREALGEEDGEMEIRIRILSGNGMAGIEVTRMVIYPAEERRVVVVSYDMYVEGVQEEEISLPGLETLLAEPDGRGGWILFTKIPSEIEEEIEDEVRGYLQQEEIQDWMGEIDRAYMEAIEDTPGVAEWIGEVQKIAAEEMAAELMKEAGLEEGRYYTVEWGDSLWRIAEAFLEDGRRWKELYDGNRELIGEDPDLILPGMELTILR